MTRPGASAAIWLHRPSSMGHTASRSRSGFRSSASPSATAGSRALHCGGCSAACCDLSRTSARGSRRRFRSPWRLLSIPAMRFSERSWLSVVIELISNNVMEPMLYGASTGISTVAILVAAVFWTWLWGPVGLLLATPLTVCIVVIGKYVPQLAFLDILLGDQPVLEPHQHFYQRLLAEDTEEASELVLEYHQQQSLEAIYNTIMLPALALAEQDRHSGRVDERRGMGIRRALRDMVEELADMDRVKLLRLEAEQTARDAHDEKPTAKEQDPAELRPPVIPKDSHIKVVALPAHDEADEIVGMMLVELLRQRGYEALASSQNALASEMLDEIGTNQADIVCVSACPRMRLRRRGTSASASGKIPRAADGRRPMDDENRPAKGRSPHGMHG